MTVFRFVRNIHLYLALFLVPWMLMYGLSVLVMNHMEFMRSFYSTKPGQTYVAKEIIYDKPLPTTTDPNAPAGTAPRIDGQAAGDQILRDLGMSGWHWTDVKRDGSQVKVGRNEVIAPRSITYTAADKKLVVERQYFHWPDFVRWLHKRFSYDRPYLADISWAVCVDLVIVSILAWGVTGLWMWYKMKPARRWGTVCLAGGCMAFTFFLLTI